MIESLVGTGGGNSLGQFLADEALSLLDPWLRVVLGPGLRARHGMLVRLRGSLIPIDYLLLLLEDVPLIRRQRPQDAVDRFLVDGLEQGKVLAGGPRARKTGQRKLGSEATSNDADWHAIRHAPPPVRGIWVEAE